MTDALTEMSGAAGAVTPHEVSRVDAVVFAAYGTTRARARTAAIEPAFRAVTDAVDVPCELAFCGPAVCRLLARRGEPAPELERVLEQVADAGARRVAIVSGMVVDGWAQANLHERVGAAADYVPQLCDCGLGEVATVRELYAHHARALFAANE